MSDAEFELELVEALNMLLEDERASVEMEVALASGATEYGEREALASMGTQDIHFCEQLREEMERAGLVVTPQINGVVFQVIGAERYDDRLRAFAHHQRVVAERARELQESNLEGDFRDAFEGISVSHDRHVQWSEQRAGEFAATRLLEFGGPARGSVLPESAPGASDPGSRSDPAAQEIQALEAMAAPEIVAEPQASEAGPEEQAAEVSLPVDVPFVEEAVTGGLDGAHALREGDEVAKTTETVAEPATKPKTARARTTRGATTAKAAAKPKTSRARSSSSTTSATTRRTRRAPATDTGDEA
ncbi:MAG TPA: hypothetical protein VE338_06300 [Ktedonobacterales bacterium]|jgi:hypothetical protein|nr:hypothetical protein [Ktedonobacterales bacterium]